MRITKLFGYAHLFLEAITSAVLTTIMVLVVLDAAMRYLWNYPLGFVYEITTLYLLIALFFLALSGSYSGGRHIRIHLIFDTFGPRSKKWASIVTEGLAIIFFAVVTSEAAQSLWISLSHHEVISGIVAWPTWPKYATVFSGTLLLTINLLVSWFSNLSCVLAGKSAGRTP